MNDARKQKYLQMKMKKKKINLKNIEFCTHLFHAFNTKRPDVGLMFVENQQQQGTIFFDFKRTEASIN